MNKLRRNDLIKVSLKKIKTIKKSYKLYGRLNYKIQMFIS